MGDSIENLKVGNIVVIENFSLQHFGNEEKSVWFIYMGSDNILEYPIYVYLCRTTTKEKNYKCIEFLQGQYGFEKSCRINLEERPYIIPKDYIESSSILIKGRLPNDIIKRIVDENLKKYLSKTQLISVRESLSKIGIQIRT